MAEEVDEEEEDEEVWQRGQNFVVGSVKPTTATLCLHVISVPKAKKKAKKRSK